MQTNKQIKNLIIISASLLFFIISTSGAGAQNCCCKSKKKSCCSYQLNHIKIAKELKFTKAEEGLTKDWSIQDPHGNTREITINVQN